MPGLALKNRVNPLSRMDETMQHANTHLEISYLARCSPTLVTCFWLYIHPKFYFCWLLIFCEWQHTRPNEMISRFMVKVHRLAEKLLAVLCCSCASLPGLEGSMNKSGESWPTQRSTQFILRLCSAVFIRCPSAPSHGSGFIKYAEIKQQTDQILRAESVSWTWHG